MLFSIPILVIETLRAAAGTVAHHVGLEHDDPHAGLGPMQEVRGGQASASGPDTATTTSTLSLHGDTPFFGTTPGIG
jgi:hypothetical protein